MASLLLYFLYLSPFLRKHRWKRGRKHGREIWLEPWLGVLAGNRASPPHHLATNLSTSFSLLTTLHQKPYSTFSRLFYSLSHTFFPYHFALHFYPLGRPDKKPPGVENPEPPAKMGEIFNKANCGNERAGRYLRSCNEGKRRCVQKLSESSWPSRLPERGPTGHVSTRTPPCPPCILVALPPAFCFHIALRAIGPPPWGRIPQGRGRCMRGPDDSTHVRTLPGPLIHTPPAKLPLYPKMPDLTKFALWAFPLFINQITKERGNNANDLAKFPPCHLTQKIPLRLCISPKDVPPPLNLFYATYPCRRHWLFYDLAELVKS